MLRSKILPAMMAAVFAFGASGAALAASGENESGQEIAAVLGAKTSVAQAITAAAQKTGGRAMRIDVEKDKGAYLYKVKTVSKEKVAEVFVDLASGQVVRTDDEGLIAKAFDQEDQSEFAKLARSSTTLMTAVATAEQHAGGKAIEASFDHEDASMIFEVEVARDNAVQKVMIDSATGHVLKVTAAEDGEHDED